MPKTSQKYDSFLNGTLREVGFGKVFANNGWFRKNREKESPYGNNIVYKLRDF